MNELQEKQKRIEELDMQLDKTRREKHILLGVFIGVLMMCIGAVLFDVFNGHIGWITWQM